MALAKVERHRMSDQIFQQMKEEILDGSLAPGAALPTETHLCATFGSSRTAVREAIRQLELLGLVDSRQGSRRTVAEHDEVWNLNLLEDLLLRGGEPDAHILDHILEVRRDFLLIMLERAAERGRSEHWEELLDIARLQSVEQDRASYLRRDLRFVAALARATGNPIYAMLLQSFLPALEQLLPRILDIIPSPAFAEPIYEDVVAALRAGNVNEARERWLSDLAEHDRFLLDRLRARSTGD